MHLLPKKSWHVWNKDNIEIVQRDEAQFRKEEERKAARLKSYVQFWRN
jgi:hypothetical protein